MRHVATVGEELLLVAIRAVVARVDARDILAAQLVLDRGPQVEVRARARPLVHGEREPDAGEGLGHLRADLVALDRDARADGGGHAIPAEHLDCARDHARDHTPPAGMHGRDAPAPLRCQEHRDAVGDVHAQEHVRELGHERVRLDVARRNGARRDENRPRAVHLTDMDDACIRGAGGRSQAFTTAVIERPEVEVALPAAEPRREEVGDAERPEQGRAVAGEAVLFEAFEHRGGGSFVALRTDANQATVKGSTDAIRNARQAAGAATMVPSSPAEAPMLSSDAFRSVLFVGAGALVLAGTAAAQRALHDPHATRSDVVSSRISPDSARVVYLADAIEDGAFELFTVSIDGGPERRLDRASVAGGDVTAYAITPDSAGAVFVGDLDTDETFELYGALLSSGPPVRLSPALVAGGDVIDFAFSPDSQRVVFRADAERDGVIELYSRPLSIGPVVKLNLPLVGARDVVDFRISDDGTRVVYRADVAANEHYELYSVPIAGGPSIQLSDVQGLYLRDYELTHSGYVVYRWYSLLYSVPITGGTAVELTSGQGLTEGFRIHPDGARVLYVQADYWGRDDLRSVPIAGGPPTTISAPMEARVDGFEISPDGHWAVYHAELGDGDLGLYSASLETPLVVELVPAAWDAGRITPDSSHVIFQSYEGLWSTPIDGGAPAQLTHGFLQALTSPDSTRFVYRSCHMLPNFFVQSELFSVPLDGGAPERLNAPLAPGGQVMDAEISPDSARVVYRADQDQDNVFELFSVPLAGGTPVQLNPTAH